MTVPQRHNAKQAGVEDLKPRSTKIHGVEREQARSVEACGLNKTSPFSRKSVLFTWSASRETVLPLLVHSPD